MSSLRTGSTRNPARNPVLRGIAGILCAMLFMSMQAFATGVVDVRWEENDLLIRFADSVSYTVDLAASDSSQLVLRVLRAELPRNAITGGVVLSGPGGREAVLTQSGPDELRITVRAAEGQQSERRRGRNTITTTADRLGYSSIWRPYSHTLVVHTFDWDKLDYGQEQYYKALLALEQGLDSYGLELLRIAYATGDSRAASALGVYHARRGEHNLAMQYLAKPLTADDYAAVAAGQLAMGDSASALRSRQTADRMNAESDSMWASSTPETRRRSGSSSSSAPEPRKWNPMDPNSRWLYLGGGIIILILLILLVIRLSRRSSSRSTAQVRREPPVAPPSYSAARREPTERTVEAREVSVTPEREPSPEPVPKSTAAPSETIVVELDPEPAPATVTPVEPVDTHAERRSASAEKIIDVEARPVTPEPVHELSAQVAELRRRIESMHQAQEQPPAAARATTLESTVDEARRLQLSRDSVELRRRLQEESGRRVK